MAFCWCLGVRVPIMVSTTTTPDATAAVAVVMVAVLVAASQVVAGSELTPAGLTKATSGAPGISQPSALSNAMAIAPPMGMRPFD